VFGTRITEILAITAITAFSCLFSHYQAAYDISAQSTNTRMNYSV